MIIRDLMSVDMTTCRPDTNLAAASALMWENDCGALAALTETGELVGFITDRDICIALGTRDARASELTVSDVVGRPSLTCKATDDVCFATETMSEAGIRHLPIVNENGVLEGVLSIDDILLSAQGVDAIGYSDLATALEALSAQAGGDQISDRRVAA